MSQISVSAARADFQEVLRTSQQEAVFIHKHGNPEAVVVSVAQYESMMDALEYVEDLEAFDAALAESAPTIPWEQVKADLGW